ncbi:hypothetical protein GS501_04870 [Saccharibacter sp. 17.LH.SD]|uniref:GH32 C-terminal domain-containing protein n=1 Tax=Saccharibacter sp. 17.LH.SD TaxID=2689393 RepID=UPI0013697C0D|nr:GH32 C-terminal domain-containing protein [Saccharibacter sp. 17.LH.SD]MXV44379.1 hypothetical protein [Saccharibacter sp. 17.LH.SD]
MTAIWQPATALSDLVQVQEGLDFSQYRPLNHITAEPFRNDFLSGPFQQTEKPLPQSIYSTLFWKGKHRPWINDPCRAVWDEKRRFWRAWMLTNDNPDYPISTWSEIVSPDLKNWTVNRLPFYQGNLKTQMLWGGSVVIDHNNTAGYGFGAVIYLITLPVGGTSPYQSVARFIAPDLGLSPVFDKIVLENPGPGDIVHAGLDFRDPRVDWDEEHQQWLMKQTVDYGIVFYASKDLEHWTFLSVTNLAAWRQVETPDFVKITAKDGTTKWVLLFCLKTWDSKPYAGVAYLVGTWDGTHFTPDEPTPHLFNHGPDYYAQAAFQHDGHTYCWGWMDNWVYSQLPTQGFTGNQTLVTELSLARADDGFYRLNMSFLEGQHETYSTYKDYWDIRIADDTSDKTWSPSIVDPGIAWRADIILKRYMPRNWSDKIQIDFCIKDNNFTRLELDPNGGTVTLSRAQSGNRPLVTNDENAQQTWLQDHQAPLPMRLFYNISIIYDVSTVEIIINNEIYISSLIFPPDNATGIKIAHLGAGGTFIKNFRLSY